MSTVNFERCGRYELREVLGEGAMGTVYRAWDPALARAVAIKVIQGWELSDDTLQRFRREAQVLAKLPHPHIVGVYDVSMAGDDPYIVMELVEGRSLAAVIHDGIIATTEHKLRTMAQVCDALACAHAAGVVHRDVKPGNILITAGGSAKLADFGIARLHDSTLTATSNIVGTPAYLAPEAFLGGPIDARTDIYGVAASLYEWLCGSRPHEANDLASLVARVTHSDAPRLSEVWKDCPASLERCLQRGLARDPADRYQRAIDLADDLAAVLKESGSSRHDTSPELTRPLPPINTGPTTSRRTRVGVLMAVAVAATLVVVAVASRGVPLPTLSPRPAATEAQPVGAATVPNTISPAVPVGSAPKSNDGTTGRLVSPAAEPGSSPSVSSAAPALEEDEIEAPRRAMPIGTKVTVSLLTELRTDRTQPGHEFEGRLAEPITWNNEVIADAGAHLRGIVDEVRAGDGNRPPSFRLSLTELTVAGTPTRVRTARYEVVGTTEDTRGASLTTLILGAATGAILGGVTGGARGAAAGGVLGASAASALRDTARPGEIVLNNPLTFKLAEPLPLASKPQ